MKLLRFSAVLYIGSMMDMFLPLRCAVTQGGRGTGVSLVSDIAMQVDMLLKGFHDPATR